MYYQQLLAESKRLEAEIKRIRSEQTKYPQGKLICSHNGKYLKWYLTDGHTKHYLPKSSKHLIPLYATYEYLSCLLHDLTQAKKSIDLFLKSYSHPKKIDSFFNKDPIFRQILSPYLATNYPQDEDIEVWLNTPYESNPLHPEALLHRTLSGQLVRSKSESMIASLLYENHIPFRYEARLTLGDTVIYPDFTILHPKTKDIKYWEHFGLMDNTNYSQKNSSKLQLYSSHDIVLFQNLIITSETKQSPLSIDTIQKIITTFFN